ncbi:NADH:ubiquinone oxidoreductase kDa subunit [Coprinopsis cinerea okayama7|uniref:NADH:ubiquinone oxidoreductase kDa subunit n=1 Tax=Coprinopsis cinerea (strain Okayama-7 / 130 / ATCC MYA-4618 / FGSC 9003) TaxID=240176 RepID=A8N1G0_COPC7|nr:NADH:ubiquinone oxidoreductase kDa subunit [Coprinopsis cinerea okayama7\|eukprot:XP_001828709.2 NADH:ubiquinone oxidoreductase kDa subunit [Coprinopsis cinerea okayama7\
MLSRRIAPQLKRSAQFFARAASSASSTKPESTKTSVPEKKTESSPLSAWQAPNFPSTWSTSQKPRPQAGSSPRFEQTNMDLQPQPLSAMELIAQEPIRLVQGRSAVCDGGGGPLGHPKIYINLDQPGPRACGYCGIRFEQDPHHHH